MWPGIDQICCNADTPDFEGVGESVPVPYFFQNLAEAEYMVTLYQFMRLVGYPADKISMLTTYNGQKALLKDVVERRCAHHPAFGIPHKVRKRDRVITQEILSCVNMYKVCAFHKRKEM